MTENPLPEPNHNLEPTTIHTPEELIPLLQYVNLTNPPETGFKVLEDETDHKGQRTIHVASQALYALSLPENTSLPAISWTVIIPSSAEAYPTANILFDSPISGLTDYFVSLTQPNGNLIRFRFLPPPDTDLEKTVNATILNLKFSQFDPMSPLTLSSIEKQAPF